jgi:hypothetical protein
MEAASSCEMVVHFYCTDRQYGITSQKMAVFVTAGRTSQFFISAIMVGVRLVR